MNDSENLTGLEFLREFAQTVSPLHLAAVAIVCGGSVALEAGWLASGLQGIAAVAVAVAVVVLHSALALAMLGRPGVQEWIRNGWRKDP